MNERSLRIDIRDQRLPAEWGHRINVSARTTNKKERAKRKAAVATIIDRGDFPTLELLRARKVHITEITNAVKSGDFSGLERVTAHLRSDSLGTAIAAFIKVTRATRRPNTTSTYLNWLTGLEAHFGAAANLELVTREAAEGWLHAPKQSGEPWAPRTQKHVKIVCGAVWKRAGAKNNPWPLVQLARVRATRTAFLQPREWRDMSAAIAGTPDHLLVALGVLAGLRIGEVLNLRRDVDVELEARRIHVQPREGAFPWVPKTDNSIRNLRIGDELYAIATRHIALGFAGQRYIIIVPKQDQPASVSWGEGRTKAAFERAGVKYGMKGDGLTNHSLRHTFGSWMAKEDVQITKIAKLMGNTVEVCATTYVHLIPEDLDAAIDVVDRIAGGRAMIEVTNG